MLNRVALSRAFCQALAMRMFLLILPLISLGLQVHAENPMTAAEFDAYTRNQTFYYGNQGRPYGAEEYLENQRVVWSFLDGNCQTGQWYQDGPWICFVYENVTDPQCWQFTKKPSGLIARFKDETDPLELYEVEKSNEPMVCLGPDDGV